MKAIPRFMPSLTFGEILSSSLGHEKGADKVRALDLFSEQFAKYIGVRYAIPAPSARVALAGLLHGLGLPRGGEVILPALTHHRIATMFLEFGIMPRFVDIKPSTYCIDAERIEEALNSSTVAIAPVHLYGRACDMEAIGRLADKHGLAVIEDCAQSCGAFYAGKRTGSFGKAAIFSFGPHKNLSMIGAGMVTTNSPELASKVSVWMNNLPRIGKAMLTKRIVYATLMRLVTRPWFWACAMDPSLRLLNLLNIDPIEFLTSESPVTERKTRLYRSLMPDNLQGRIGLCQLKKLDVLNRQRISNGGRLMALLKDISGIGLSELARDGENIYMSFVVRVKDRKVFCKKMRMQGVDTHPGNMFVGPMLPGLEGRGECAVALDAMKHMVHIPVYPELKESEINKVAEAAINSVLF